MGQLRSTSLLVYVDALKDQRQADDEGPYRDEGVPGKRLPRLQAPLGRFGEDEEPWQYENEARAHSAADELKHKSQLLEH